MKKTDKCWRSALLLLVMAVTMLPVATVNAVSTSAEITEILFQPGDSEIIGCKGLNRMAIGDPVIADVTAASTHEFLVNAKSPGTTMLYVWDKSGRKVYKITVQSPEIDMAQLCASIVKEIDDSRITVRNVGDTLVMEGVVTVESDSMHAEALAKAAIEQTKQSKLKIENLVRVEKAIDEVSSSTMETAAAIRQALNNPIITVRALPGNVVMVEGKVGTQPELDKITQCVKGWDKQGSVASTPGVQSPGRVSIVNSVELDTSVARQVMVHAQVVDINKNALKDFGLDWGRVVTTDDGLTTVVDQPFLIGQAGTGPFDLFGGGQIFRLDPIGARVRALEQQNKAKILSQPNLLVLDGREASMLVGGEIPIPIVQSAQIGSAVSVTVEYKEFGVRLRIMPTITSESTLQLKVLPEVSALDFANGVVFSGFRIPAFRTRRAETIVNVRDGQSLIIGGLMQNEVSKLVRKIPVLGDLPILGELFKTRSFVNNETELVIIITPQIVKPTAQAQLPATPAPAPTP